jgi:hypothetical protein
MASRAEAIQTNDVVAAAFLLAAESYLVEMLVPTLLTQIAIRFMIRRTIVTRTLL